jgi:hypothetical protein
MFHSKSMRFTPEQLTFKALLVVHEAVHHSSNGPVKLTLGLRFALAYLCATTKNSDIEMFKRFAACIGDPQASQTKYMGNYMRSLQARGFLTAFMEGAGLAPSIDNQAALRLTFERLTDQPKASPPSKHRKG